jgi:hypothetical protein
MSHRPGSQARGSKSATPAPGYRGKMSEPFDVPSRLPARHAAVKRPRKQVRPEKIPAPRRSVAQPGSAPRSGRGGRRFKSSHSDQYLFVE